MLPRDSARREKLISDARGLELLADRREQIQAAIDSYGEQAMAQLMQELGELEGDLPARFNAEGAYRIP